MLLSLLLACSSPTVTITVGAHPDAPKPGTLAEALDNSFRRPIQACYEEAIRADGDLAGDVVYRVHGSHGILSTKVQSSAGPALEQCAVEPMSNSRLMRQLGDGDTTIGFELTVRFDPG